MQEVKDNILLMKSVLNVCIGKPCLEVVFSQWSEIWVWKLSKDFKNYLPFRLFRCLTVEKQHGRPHNSLSLELKDACPTSMPYMCNSEQI